MTMPRGQDERLLYVREAPGACTVAHLSLFKRFFFSQNLYKTRRSFKFFLNNYYLQNGNGHVSGTI